jgi:hypothetical protein
LVSVPAAGIIAPNIPYVQHDIKLCDIWRRCKSIKRALSIITVKDLCDMKNIISNSWDKFSISLSYGKAWIEKFLLNRGYRLFC